MVEAELELPGEVGCCHDDWSWHCPISAGAAQHHDLPIKDITSTGEQILNVFVAYDSCHCCRALSQRIVFQLGRPWSTKSKIELD